jgi:hypothetical protein
MKLYWFNDTKKRQTIYYDTLNNLVGEFTSTPEGKWLYLPDPPEDRAYFFKMWDYKELSMVLIATIDKRVQIIAVIVVVISVLGRGLQKQLPRTIDKVFTGVNERIEELLK